MTEERSHSDNVEDALVSRTYREAAGEQVPDDLDRAVLHRARQHSSNRYSRSVIWLRPMAWAATIGLCLAIVVEINNVPQSMPVPLVLPAAPEDALTDAEKLDVEAVEAPRIQGGAATTDMNKAIAPQRFETELRRQRAKKTVDDQGRVDLQNVPQHSKTEARETGFVQAEIVDSLESKDTAILTTCDEKVRSTPQTWLECIETLEDGGLDAMATEQRELLREAFPDFDIS